MPTPPTQGKDYINWTRLTPTPSPHGTVYAHARDPGSGDHLLAHAYTVHGLTRPTCGTAILEIPPSELARVPDVAEVLDALGKLILRCDELQSRVDDRDDPEVVEALQHIDLATAALAAWE